jgi:hypothetical protein
VLSSQSIDVPTPVPTTVAPQVLGPGDEVWLVRPDAHVAAVGTVDEIVAAIRTQFG